MSSVVRAARTAGAASARHATTIVRCLMRMRIGVVVTGGVDASGRERVVPALLWLVERLARRDAARVTVATNWMAAMPALGGVRVDVVPIGVDPRLFPMATRAEGPPWRLLRVGSINRVKDYPTLLRAFAQLRSRSLDVHLDIV